ncbi:MAG: hypothetical protein FIA82_07955 [Melioribacter sp.]|nr:hypothetical protein [Melioribacter sp.]
MNIPVTISIISTAIWILPPIKQYKSDYFYFFLILAFLDVMQPVVFFFLHMDPRHVAIIFLLFLISSLPSSHKQRYFFIILGIFTSVFFLGFSFQNSTLTLIRMAMHVIIVIILINSFVKYTLKVKAVNLFLIILITYELITVFKFIAGILSFEEGAFSYVIATFIQIFFGIAFLFISFKTKDFPIHVKD